MSFILLVAALLRVFDLQKSTMFIGDQAWFFISARDALLTGFFPLLGITSSITWLHQGPLWTYLLIPILFLGQFDPYIASLFTSFLSLISLVLLYFLSLKLFNRKTATLLSVVFSILPFSVFHSRFAFSTSVVPLFTTASILLLLKRRSFLSGSFIGFLYQSHLLTFIFWPAFIYLAIKYKLQYSNLLFGFLLGVLPFILAGPIQLFGIFIWSFKALATGLPSSEISEAYKIVLLIPTLLLLGFIIKKIPFKLIAAIILIVSLYSVSHQYFTYHPSLLSRLNLSREIITLSSTSAPKITIIGDQSEFASSRLPYEYLVWWISRSSSPTGRFNHFEINDPSQEFRVIK